MKDIIVNKKSSNIINERSTVISDDMNERLKDYLNNDEFIEELSVKLNKLEHGEMSDILTLQINPSEFGILTDDIINIKCDKSDPNNPKFFLWIMSEKYMFDNIDFDTAANLLFQSGKGSGIEYVGNLLGSLVGAGDAGDDGTDADSLIGIAGAFASISADRGVDPKIYFDKLAEVFSNKHGESIDNFLETEFSGRAEVAALNTFRRKIPDSISRGVDLPNILLDIATTVVTFGGGTAAKLGLKGATAAPKALRYAETATVAAGATKKGLSGLKIASKMKGAWNGLTDAVKASRFKKALPVGSEIAYTGKKGGAALAKTVTAYSKNAKGELLVHLNKETPVLMKNIVADAGKAEGISMGVLAKLVPGTAAKYAKLGMPVASATKLNLNSTSPDFNFAEMMGWYDTLTADPTDYIKNVEATDSKDLASMIYDLKTGSGFWGNTTDQEELAMSLIITSLTPEGAREVQSKYDKVDTDTVYSVLDDELGGDMGLFAKSWWASCTGEGLDQLPKILQMKNKISPSNKK